MRVVAKTSQLPSDALIHTNTMSHTLAPRIALRLSSRSSLNASARAIESPCRNV